MGIADCTQDAQPTFSLGGSRLLLRKLRRSPTNELMTAHISEEMNLMIICVSLLSFPFYTALPELDKPSVNARRVRDWVG